MLNILTLFSFSKQNKNIFPRNNFFQEHLLSLVKKGTFAATFLFIWQETFSGIVFSAVLPTS
jgi:hypothetical protein